MHSRSQTWRELLATLLRDGEERKRLARALEVSEATLQRWASSDPKAPRPHPDNLLRLIDHVPRQYRDPLVLLLHEEFPDLRRQHPKAAATETREIPSFFVFQVLEQYTKIAHPQQRFWSICTTVLQQLTGQLDPDQQGLRAMVWQCVPPAEGRTLVRSLVGRFMLETGLWPEGFERTTILVGAESLAGYAVSFGQPTVAETFQQPSPLPVWPLDGEESAFGCPIMKHGNIAGCLSVSSTQPHAFPSTRQVVLGKYAQLLSLAFETFYPSQQIRLGEFPRPHLQTQRPYWTEFSQCLAEWVAQEQQETAPLSLPELEMAFVQDLEAALLCPPQGEPQRAERPTPTTQGENRERG